MEAIKRVIDRFGGQYPITAPYRVVAYDLKYTPTSVPYEEMSPASNLVYDAFDYLYIIWKSKFY